MELTGQHLGMTLSISALDHDNAAYFGYCAKGELRLQRCRPCGLIRAPPGPACPWCAASDFEWVSLNGRGKVYSYTEVRHAVQPAFLPYLPYVALLVELDEQRAQPSDHEALRLIGNLALADGTLASPDVVRQVGIGSRVRVVFARVGEGLAIPLWTLDESASQPDSVWRYPELSTPP